MSEKSINDVDVPEIIHANELIEIKDEKEEPEVQAFSTVVYNEPEVVISAIMKPKILTEPRKSVPIEHKDRRAEFERRKKLID